MHTPPEAHATPRTRRRCDRVLWRSWPGCAAQLQQLCYASVPQVVSSDHTPVHSAFTLTLACPRLEARAQLIPGLRLQLSDLRAEHLTPHDANGLADPYIEVRYLLWPCSLWPSHSHSHVGAPRAPRGRRSRTPHTCPRLRLQVRPSFTQQKRTSTVRSKTLSPTWEGECLQLPVPASRAWPVSLAATSTYTPPCRPLAASLLPLHPMPSPSQADMHPGKSL